MQRRSVPRNDPRYGHLRARNNDSVKKSREKSRREYDETMTAITQLEDENNELTQRIDTMKQEYDQLQQLFKQHTGIAIDQLMTASSSSTPAPTSTPVEQPKETPKPVITINTNEDKKSTASSEPELDASDLDGAIVLINGVQYKIVSLNKN